MTLTTIESSLTDLGRPHVQIFADRCAGCQECVVRCPAEALSMDTERWIAQADDALCIGCRQCTRTCPFSAIVVTGSTQVAPRVEPAAKHPTSVLGDVSEIRSGFANWDEALAAAERCLNCPDPTCVRGCPAHNDIPGFVGAILERDLIKAHEILRRTSVLPDICSRVCNQAAQCEGACSWSLAGDEPVAIGRLERFVTDNLPVPPPAPSGNQPELSVAIIGSGPGAAGAAWELREAGAAVTVFEKDAVPGGLCNWGIPDFTLPDEVARRPWHQLQAAGVDVRCGTEIKPDALGQLSAEYDAVVLAIGAGMPLRLPVPGADLAGVVDATSFLQGAKLALEPQGDPSAFLVGLGLTGSRAVRATRILVLGAGNTAMDVARTGRRLGVDAICVDWLDERFALARPDELAEARFEGVDVRFQRTVTGLSGSAGRVTHARLALTTQDNAKDRPKVLANRTEDLEVDLVVMAMGYSADPAFAALLPGTPVRREVTGVPDRGWMASGILANPASAFANHSPVGRLALGREVGLDAAAMSVGERMWTVGDALIGPGTVVEAMAQGRRAAAALLDARPARQGRSERAQGPARRRVLIGYASAGGRTARAAAVVADELAAHGDQVRTLPISRIGAVELAAADLLILGSWVEGFVFARVRPARAMRTWLAGIPWLGSKPVALFVTFGVAPKDSLVQFQQAVAAKGGVVLSSAAFAAKRVDSKSSPLDATEFVASVMSQVALGSVT